MRLVLPAGTGGAVPPRHLPVTAVIRRYLRRHARAAVFLCISMAATQVGLSGTTWDGGGTGSSWGTAANWSPDGLPLFNGTEQITIGSAFTSGTTLTLNGNRNISSLLLNARSTAFTISAGTGGALGLYSGNITLSDVTGTEGLATISSGIVLGNPSSAAGYTGTWSIDGSAGLRVTGDITETGGSRGINKTGAAMLTLSGTNTFSGGLTLTAGTVSVSSDTNLGASSGPVTFAGGTLQATQNVSGSRAINTGNAGNSAIFDVAFGKIFEQSGAISGNGNLVVISSGTVILSGSGSYGTGTTSISSGLLSLRGTVTLGSGNLTFGNGILGLGNGNFSRALGTGAGQVNMNSATGGAGFSAWGADRSVNLGGSSATVTWGTGSFVANGQTLYLGAPTATHLIDFQNPINLAGLTGTISVTDGTGSGIDAKLSGAISGTVGTSNLVVTNVAAAGWNPGTLLLSNGNNSYAGTTTVNAGTLLLGANATGTAGNTVLGSGTSDVLVGNTSGAYNSGLLTDGAVTVARNIRAQSGNTGVVTLGGYSANASTFSGNIFLGTTNIATGKGVTLTAAGGGTVTFSGVIQDATGTTTRGVVTKEGAGTVALTNANTYGGGTIINAGTLSVVPNALGSAGVTINAGTLQIATGFTTSRSITLGNTASTIQVDPTQTLTLNTAMSGAGSLNKSGSGTLVLNSTTTNTYSGATNITDGTLRIGGAERIPNASAVTVSGGTLDVQTFTETVGQVTLSGGSITGSGTGTLSGSSYAMQSGAASAILNGSGTLTKSTSGTVTLTGANTFSGSTTVTGGTLELAAGGGSALGSTSSVTVNGGGTLLLGASNQVSNSAPVTLAGGTIGKGNFSEGSTSTPGLGALTLTASGSRVDFGGGTVGTVTFASFTPGAFSLTIDNWTGNLNSAGSDSTDRLIFNSDQTANLSSFSFSGYGDGATQFALGDGFYEVTPVTPVPEPSTYVAAALAAMVAGYHLLGRRRRMRERRQLLPLGGQPSGR